MWPPAIHFITQSSWNGGSVPCWHPQSIPWYSCSHWLRLCSCQTVLLQHIDRAFLLWCLTCVGPGQCYPNHQLYSGLNYQPLDHNSLHLLCPLYFHHFQDCFSWRPEETLATCASHLTVVIVHYSCASIAYFKLKSENTKDKDQLTSVTYPAKTPLLNLAVYSLRNKEAQDTLWRVVSRNFFPRIKLLTK